jgi:hypothetical protein
MPTMFRERSTSGFLSVSLIGIIPFFTGACCRVPAARPVVSQLHVVSVHVPDHATFDAVFLLFRDTLKLPVVFGDLSKPGSSTERLYAGFSVGNAYLEPCGPYQNDAPFSAAQPARFHGLTFSSAPAIAAAAAELECRHIPAAEIAGSGHLPRYIYLKDTLLSGEKQAVSIWEIQNKNDQVCLDALRSSLQAAQGGPLGVERMDEVWLDIPGEQNLAQWSKLLAPAKCKGRAWLVGDGPALRITTGKELGIEAIILKVASLKAAEEYLLQAHLVNKHTPDGLELDTKRTSGLRIILKESRHPD